MAKTRRKRAASILVGVLLVVTTIYAVDCFLALHSGALEAAREFVVANATVRDRLGPVTSVSFVPWHFHFDYKGTGGYATLQVNVRSNHGEARVSLDLIRDLGRWRVSRASMRTTSGKMVALR